MDPWVVSEVLRPNLECTGFVDNSVIHTMCVESFLKQAEESKGMYASRSDFIWFWFILHFQGYGSNEPICQHNFRPKCIDGFCPDSYLKSCGGRGGALVLCS